jgi:hypothetical protein
LPATFPTFSQEFEQLIYIAASTYIRVTVKMGAFALISESFPKNVAKT